MIKHKINTFWGNQVKYHGYLNQVVEVFEICGQPYKTWQTF